MNNNIQNVVKSEALEGLQQETKVQIFSNNEFGQVRTTLDENGEPLFCLSDVCNVLELDSSQVQKRLDKGVFTIHPLLTNGGIQNANFVNEDGLYDVILDSRKPSAKKFRKWITSEVLPSIRKTGSYSVQKQLPKDYLSALKALVKSEEEKQQLALENETMKPKVDSYDKFLEINDSMTMTSCAKKFSLTAQKLNNILVLENVIYKKGNSYFPRAKYQNKGYFKLVDVSYGENSITSQLRLTPKGQDFVKKILSTYGLNEQGELFNE